jgi:hypothetical protein
MFDKTKPKLLDSTLASETLRAIGNKPANGSTKISELMEDFHENGILLAMIFFALPVAIPLPYPPGFTTIMGAPLIILSIQMILGSKKVNLPKRINQYELKNSTLKTISNKIVPPVEAIEKYTKPRINFVKSVYCEQIVGFTCLISAISVAIPLPFTNAIPAFGITVMALGMLSRDGFVIIAGFLFSILGLIVAAAFIIASWVTIKYLFIQIFSLQ